MLEDDTIFEGIVIRVVTGLHASRKVRTPKGRVLDNVQAGRPDGKRHRKEKTRRLQPMLLERVGRGGRLS